MGVSSLNKEVLFNPGETSHVGKHLSITALTSVREHGGRKLTLCTEVCTSRPSSLRPRTWAYFGDRFRVRAVLRSARSAEPRRKRAGFFILRVDTAIVSKINSSLMTSFSD